MPGTLISLAVQPGDKVESGQEIAVVEVRTFRWRVSRVNACM